MTEILGGYEANGEMITRHYQIRRISDGLAFGEGSISGQDEAPEVLNAVDEAIHHSAEILVPVDRDDDGEIVDDDGCGDGRETTLVYRVGETFKRSLNRAKVFGGAVAMSSSALIGQGLAKGETLNQVFDSSIERLRQNGIDFGAHTDEQAHGDNCGCGAIDRAPEVLTAALKFEQPIRKVIAALKVDPQGLDEVYANFRAYFGELPGQPHYSGRLVMEHIMGAGKVIKRLSGEHKERRIILNTVPGYTVNQKLIRDVSGGRAQAFAVDLWRLEDIALHLEDDFEAHHRAFLSELIYTLATAAVLTKGDLPVDMIEEAPVRVPSYT